MHRTNRVELLPRRNRGHKRSGARTFKYGATRNHICRLRIALSTGELLDLRRGKFFAEPDGTFALPLESGRTLAGKLPGYRMPQTRKNASGYYIAPGMDLIDLFIGSEGTLGLVTEVETRLLPLPKEQLSGVVFFESQDDLLSFVTEARDLSFASRRSQTVNTIDAIALEYFDSNPRFHAREQPFNPIAGRRGNPFRAGDDTRTETICCPRGWNYLKRTVRCSTIPGLPPTKQTEPGFATSTCPPSQGQRMANTSPTAQVSTDMGSPMTGFPRCSILSAELKSAACNT